MNYELAKELKSAGFPQEKATVYWWKYWKFPKVDKISRPFKDDEFIAVGYELDPASRLDDKRDTTGYWELVACAPTLSELIAACTPTRYDEFLLMTGYTDLWECVARYSGATEEVNKRGSGSNPEEAVAKLWLALNKNG